MSLCVCGREEGENDRERQEPFGLPYLDFFGRKGRLSGKLIFLRGLIDLFWPPFPNVVRDAMGAKILILFYYLLL